MYTWGNNGNGGTTLQTSNTVTATYNGDDTAGDFSSSASSNYSVTEGKDTTFTTISGATTVVFNQKILYTATIAATGVGAPGFPVDGTVMFSIDGGAGVPEPITNGVATFDPPHWGNPASGGAHTVDARYIGNDTAGDYSSSSATQYSVTENSDDTTTTISGATTVVFKQKVTYTATIAAVSPGSGAPVDGHVTFSIDGGAGPTVLVANGIATDVVTWGNPADGNMHTVDATYLGDDTLADFNSSMATTYNVTENSDDTITTITTSSGNFTPVTNETVTYTATISAINNGAGAPVDGTVTFHILGVNSFIPLHNGVATTTVTWGAAGTVDNAFRATYDGNDSAVDYKGSISTTHSITVGKDSTTTTLAPSDANPGVGENVTWTATLSATPPAPLHRLRRPATSRSPSTAAQPRCRP